MGGAKPHRHDPKDTGHWRFVEFGTVKMPARPFMRPALADHINDVIDAYAKDMNDRLDELLK